MSDVFSKRKRSAVMAAIRSRGNRSTELRLMQVFRTHGITGWRRGRALPGRPDFVFPEHRAVVFVDGCFWHGCPRHATWPKARAKFWRDKIEHNRSRDRRASRELRGQGWRVLRVWEHALCRRNEARLRARLRRFLARGSP